MTDRPERRRLGFHYDDLRLGQAWRTGGHTVTADAVIRFAAEWDNQDFHTDREAADDSVFGMLVGSGLQTVMLSYRLYHALALLDGTALAGLGIDAIRFHAPLRPDDTIHVLVTVAALAETSRTDRGVVTWGFETRNQRDTLLMTLTLTALVARRGVTLELPPA